MKILFMCVANSARSQLAEGLAKEIFGAPVSIESAGSNPSKVNPLAIEVLKEAGIDISRNYSKTVNDISPQFLVDMDYVITLCAEEVCPLLVSKAKKLHWPLPDPAGQTQLSYDDQLKRFRDTREAIRAKLIAFKKELGL
jgi:arsenate reductase